MSLPRRTPGATGAGPGHGAGSPPALLLQRVADGLQRGQAPAPLPDHGAAREALLIAARTCDDLAQRNAETAALSFGLQAAGAIVRRCWELAVRWEAGARRLAASDPDSAASMRMAAAELQDVIAGDYRAASASWPLPPDELAAWRRGKGRQP